MFTATKLQVATYLLGVCPFSIAFLVFLNSSVSFVITDLIGVDQGVGDAVGNLGFADELLALIACPFWGLLSDRIGVRTVCVIGYTIVALALVLFVQAKDVYPQLLLGRLFFSLGGAAASTMVTAVLPTMSFVAKSDSVSESARPSEVLEGNGHAQTPSISSELTITPARFRSRSRSQQRGSVSGRQDHAPQALRSSSSQIAGYVGTGAGCGALLALLVFLPLPARFQKMGVSPAQALQYSYYITAAVALVIALVCWIGFRNLRGEPGHDSSSNQDGFKSRISLLWKYFCTALLLGISNRNIRLGYIGGFVARASSVGISLFVPLLVNASFLESGLCSAAGGAPGGLPDLKRKCPQAYVLAAELTGVAQLLALLSAPLFGYVSGKLGTAVPLLFASVAGIVGYPVFATQFTPDGHKVLAFLSVCLIGISQIGAIVGSLATLSDGVLQHSAPKKGSESPHSHREDVAEAPSLDAEARAATSTEQTSLLPGQQQDNVLDLADLKGSIAGMYSLYGGAGILLLTKLGGFLFDKVSFGAPFYIMAVFNAILMVACTTIILLQNISGNKKS